MISRNARRTNKIRKPLVAVKDFSRITEPKAELLAEYLTALKAEGNVLIVLDADTINDKNLAGAAKNLDNVKIIMLDDLKSEDVAAADCIVTTDMAITEITERLSE